MHSWVNRRFYTRGSARKHLQASSLLYHWPEIEASFSRATPGEFWRIPSALHKGPLEELKINYDKAIHSQSPKSPKQAFIDAARAAEADEEEKRWEARLKAVAKAVAPQPVKSARKAMAKSAAKPAKKT